MFSTAPFETMYKTFLMALVLGFSTLNSADACPMADAAAFQEAAAKVAATEGAHASIVIDGMTCGSCSTKVSTHLDGVDGVLASAHRRALAKGQVLRVQSLWAWV